MTLGQHVFILVPAWLIAAFCFAIAMADVYLSCKKTAKRWPKRLKAVNWLFIGGVYLYIAFGTYTNEDVRVLIRISVAFLIAGEAAYHVDTFQDMTDDAISLIRRLTKNE